MSVEWEQAPPDVVDLLKELVEKHHPPLKNARIGVLFRETGVMRNSRLVLGTASKVTGKTKALLDEPLDFLIWVAADWWEKGATPLQRKALLDHELCHCAWTDAGWAMRGHDLEEFGVIVERYGLNWRDDFGSERFARAIQQQRLPFREPEHNGGVVAINPRGLGLAELSGE